MAMSLKRRNPLLFPILTGSGTAYSGQKQPFVLGYNTVLAGGLQTRNGARVTYVGSMDLLGNRFFDALVNKFGSDKGSQQSGNAEFAEELSKWSLQERGVLRHRNVYHHKKNETVQPSQYRVGDDAVYSVIIEEWTGNKWEPFVANDIQVDFIMLHPYVRTFLKHVGNGKYEADIKVPDVYGCFKFKVDYRRTGYTNLIFEDGITVRPMRMNEFERFIPAAFPYYATVFSVMAGFFIFCVVFMFTGDKSKRD
jgi:oligosaccharyltransferase complex subunit beta